MDFRKIQAKSALADLRDLVRYIARDNGDVARKLGDLIVTKVESLATFPRIAKIGSRTPDGQPAGIHRASLSNRV